jgi:hypothetical protein
MPKYPYRELGVGFDRNFRNDLNANFADIEADIKEVENNSIARDNELDTRIDNIVADVGSSNTEIVDARYDSVNDVTHPTLKDRLDSHSNEIGILSNEKADKSYVDTKIANILDGSPKGAYATLTDLQVAYPTGTEGVYVVAEDGKWYYWNGSAWTAGGVYQGTVLPDESVTTEKIKYVDVKKINRNILRDAFFNKFTAEDADYLSKFAVDANGNLYNTSTSASIYEFNSIPIAFPKSFELKFTITVNKASENGQFHGFVKSSDTTTRFMFGYEPAHNAFEIYRPSTFKVLDADTNFADGDYTFTFRYVNGFATLRIQGSNYDKIFKIEDYFDFDPTLYDAIRLQFKIPALGNTLKDLSFRELEKLDYVDKTGLKVLSERGSTPGRNVHIYRFGGRGNDWCFVRTPDNYDPNGKPHPFVICNHGNGWVMDGTEAKANWTSKTQFGVDTQNNGAYLDTNNPYYVQYSNETIERLLEAGYVVCGAQNYGDNLYGNDDCRQACVDFYFHMIRNYNVEEKCFMIGASNGAMTTLNAIYLLGGTARVKAAILQYPLTCLWRHYANYAPHRSAIEAAYGIPSGLSETDFEKATRTHDPEKVLTFVDGSGIRRKLFNMPPIKIYYSLTDSVTAAVNNALPFIQLLEDSNLEVEGVQVDTSSSAEHGDWKHFDPVGFLTWFEKYR